MFTEEGAKKVQWSKVKGHGPALTWYRVITVPTFRQSLFFFFFPITPQLVQEKVKQIFFEQTRFDAPEGRDPVAIRMTGMGKGMIWVNGKNIGRYWMSYLSPLRKPSQEE